MEIDYRSAGVADEACGHGGATALICAVLLVLFAGVAWLAVRGKSATYDEPVHVVAAWEQIHGGDFRLDPENPSLWKFWAGLPNGRDAIANPPTAAAMNAVGAATGVTNPVVVPALYGNERTDAERIVARSRVMMLGIAVLLGGVIGWWSWRLGGAVAAITATAAFALDPNFLAHGALVKNDIVVGLVLVGLVMSVWRAGRRVTVLNACAIALLCAAAVNVKFTGLVFGPIVALLLLARAMMAADWQWLGRTLRTRAARVGASAALCGFALLVSYVGIWACYGFRYAPSRNPEAHFDTLKIVQFTAFTELTMRHPERTPSTAEMASWEPGAMLRAICWMNDQRVLPEAWLTGLAYTKAVSVAHQNFLLGERALVGWWSYFPIAMVVKAPVAALLAVIAALVVGIVAVSKRCHPERTREGSASSASTGRCFGVPQHEKGGGVWLALCLIAPAGIYLLCAMGSNMQYGVRHVLPVYPFIFIGIGLAAARAWAIRPRLAGVVIAILALGMIAETAGAFPNYISFFNVAAGGQRGGIKLLGCSNLDWGQDLKLLAAWQREHADRKLYAIYYGVAEPAYYGVRTSKLAGSSLPLGEDAIIAVSATYLQGLYLPPQLSAALEPLRHAEPIDVLGGSIYLFDASNLREKP